MSCLYDVSLHLDDEGNIKNICWKNNWIRQRYENFWKVYEGMNPETAEEFCFHQEKETVYWHNDLFRFQREDLGNGESILFLKRGMDREMIFKCALDTLDESIQIYDDQGTILYFNRTGRETVGVKEEIEIEGKHLLDVFAVDADESTTLEALRMGAPVRNRFKHYFSRQGTELFTVNSAFPVLYDGQVIAALSLEENISVISRKSQRLEMLQAVMEEKIFDSPLSRKNTGYTFADLVGHHPLIQSLKELAAKVAGQNSNVLIVGETGTGKEILAQSIHRASPRKNGPFLPLNCAAVPENLIESILFGTVKGSYTGSLDKPGLLEEAHKGTLFLDELNSMSFGMQAKVLRAIQEGRFRRVGGNKEYKVDVRIISSCNENPFSLMDQKTLRPDLFYRLATIILEIPPLRDRKEDIEELVRHRINQIRSSYAFPFKEIPPETLWHMHQYEWPGNVRELFHAVDYAMNVASDDVFRLKYLPSYCFRKTEEQTIVKEPGGFDREDCSVLSGTLAEQVASFEADLIRKTLQHFCGNVSQTARQLGLQRQSLQYRIRKYGIVN